MACVGLGKTTESLRYQQQALPLIHESGDRRSEADVLDHIGHALTDLGRYDEAIVHHTRALELRRQIRDDFDATLTLANLAAAYRAAGRLSEAAESMKQVIDAVEAARATQSSRTYRGKVLARKLMYYEQFIDLLLEMHQHEPDAGHDAAALHVSERARARLTLDAIEQAHAEGESGLGAARPLTAKEIQEQLLDGETMLLEYSVGDERSVAWSVTRQSLTTHILPKRDTISAAARRLHQLLSAGDQRLRRHDLAEAVDTMSRLALNDVTLPKYVRRIVIVADGALQYVPFSLLHLRGSSQPLIERVEIVTAPSASTVVAMRRLVANRPSQHGIAVFADPVFGADDERLDHGRRAARPAATRGGTTLAELSRLPYTRNEAESILRLAPRGSLRALGFEARREAVVSADLAGFDVIHFATHAIVDAERTGIVLSLLDAHGRNVNGMIALQDVFSLRLGASLVVLSACRTALGSDLRGEGMVSLVRAFMHAGVPRVAATYWDVKDASTAALMRSFYRAMLVDHLPPAAALRSAQLEMLRGGRWRAPHHWAAFTLQGDWR
jgi:CHAT domain-containing protein